MRDILSKLKAWRAAGEEVAMATLVEVRQSAPREPGARFCVTGSGQMVGSVSAGCVESDLFERAQQVLASGRSELVEYGITREEGFAVGLSCGGEIDLLVQPLEEDESWLALAGAVESGESVVLIQAVEPASLCGRRLVVETGGRVIGSVGGPEDPELDARLVERASQLLARGGSECVRIPRDDGDVRVFLEALVAQRRLFIIGGNHTGIHLCRMAKELGYRVTVVDPRSVFATPERFAEADELLDRWPDEVLAEERLDASAYVVVLTHDLKFDVPSLDAALRQQTRYIGALGSRRTHAKRVAALREKGWSDEDLQRIHSPIGLDLGGRAPEEIALSILAEMQTVRHGSEGRALRELAGPIHAKPVLQASDRRAGE